MKKQLLIFCLLAGLLGTSKAQTYSNCPGDSIKLKLPSYTGSLQWQESTDSVNWSNISGATYQPYGFVFVSTKFYRAMVTANGCNPSYSAVQKVVNNTNCGGGQYPAGTVHCGGTTTAVVDVTNPTTGKTWMDRNLGASQVAASSTDSLAYGDLYQWGRGNDGHQCRNSAVTLTLSSTDQPGNSSFILTPTNTPYDWRNPQNVNLWQGVNGVNNPCPTGYRLPTETEINAERLSFSTQNAAGAFASPLKLPVAGYRSDGNGLIYAGAGGLYWSSTVSTTNSRVLYFDNNSASMSVTNRSRGYPVRCIKEPGSVGALNCGSATVTGNLISGQAASNVSASVPYTSGNGSYHSGQTVSSTGVTGLTATLSAGNFANGSGALTYSITGTPSTNGTASFALNIGGQTCTQSVSVSTLAGMYPAGSVFCNGPTAIAEVTNPATGRTWMDRNLGASRAATSSTDAQAYGDLYQWGRGADGHQCRNSAITSTLSSTDQPGNSSFILTQNTPFDWRNPQNNNFWQGVNGVNNPCPSGYRLPTETELNNERLSWVQSPISSSNNSSGAFASPLKLSLSGNRDDIDGAIFNVGNGATYWSSSVIGSNSQILIFDSSDAVIDIGDRSLGFSVRCIKD
jgi:uncharacterized protein (TIGR02145 family)